MILSRNVNVEVTIVTLYHDQISLCYEICDSSNLLVLTKTRLKNSSLNLLLGIFAL